VTNDGRLNPQHGAGNSSAFHGHAADTDVVVASTKAYLSALNRLLAALGTYDQKQTTPHGEDASGAAE
jgi:2-isopropylmalate synthase